jgi:hypothetical protein
MGYEDLIRAGVVLASSQFDSMKMAVTHTPWTSDDGAGNNSYGSPTTRHCLVDFSGRGMLRYTKGGILIMELAKLTFLDPVPANGAALRQEPIDLRDKIVLPDGQTAPVVDTGGFGDVATGQPFVLEVTLGSVLREGQ